MEFDPICCYCHRKIGNIGIFDEDLVFCSQACYDIYKKMFEDKPEPEPDSVLANRLKKGK